MGFLRIFFAGLTIGIANIIPGVSGGTMAVIFGVYDRLLSLISVNLKKILSDWKFILIIVAGMACGIFFFSKLLSFLIETYPAQSHFVFIGIILGGMPVLFSHLGKKEEIKPIPILFFILGFACMLALFFAEGVAVEQKIITELSTFAFMYLLVLGIIAAFTMIIPGISGSLMLLILGGYPTFLNAVSELRIPLLIPIAIGVLIGLFFGARLIRLLLSSKPQIAYSLIIGLVLGSIIYLFPGLPKTIVSTAISLACLACGFCVSWFFSKGEK